ncbi:MAG: hypothetical protein HN542_07675 [Flavobacteriales bacterium]|jgi:hypothetical protein|nr:hypothetical protein [Flavobacteriales bacterium]MBT4704360.1 hypothetical protein [Flavobacteriales bacterium]MBT4930484.1 hypothetical protein [Flavobacteriales bacterium]MBT5131760.1 hypothetical protein [Flavobacteriales bacterium]MBT5977795.1 hypothetical protein [Flavobacteriales bacterium]
MLSVRADAHAHRIVENDGEGIIEFTSRLFFSQLQGSFDQARSDEG